MARDRLAEIAAVRGRGRSGPWRGKHVIQDLHDRAVGDPTYPAAFIVIRLVTALEVFTRDWVRELIDAGDPYLERAGDLVKGTLKIDFAVARSLVGQHVTFGDLVAHDIPLNNIGDFDRIFSTLLGAPVFDRMTGVVDRWEVEVLEKPAVPILRDPGGARALLKNLFETRHIHVHELPDDPELERKTVTAFSIAAMQVCDTLDQVLSTEVRGDYPLTQLAMNFQAGERARLADVRLQALLTRADPDGANQAFQAAQEAWEIYRTLQAEYRSNINSETRGSIAPLIYHSEEERLTLARIDDLERYLNRPEGDM